MEASHAREAACLRGSLRWSGPSDINLPGHRNVHVLLPAVVDLVCFMLLAPASAGIANY